MPKRLVIVDDQKDIAISTKTRIQLGMKDVFDPIDIITDPAQSADSIPEGKLFRFLLDKFADKSFTGDYYIILDISFGNDHRHILGLAIAKYLLQESVYADRLRIMAFSNHDNVIYFNQLYLHGVKVIIHKTNLENLLIHSLQQLIDGKSFLDGFSYQEVEEITAPIRLEVAKLVAKGYAPKAITKRGYASVGPMKHTFKWDVLNVEFLAEVEDIDIEIPIVNEDENKDEWNDILFLLYFLRKGDKEIIEYIEKACHIRIEKPRQ
ncbi:MAG: response regulator transcription factor [Lewinellaceae bacterium]|nr:response regulator transcription factor [Lewinellaceae bacterium]